MGITGLLKGSLKPYHAYDVFSSGLTGKGCQVNFLFQLTCEVGYVSKDSLDFTARRCDACLDILLFAMLSLAY
jgi:hypothetical protein